MTAMITEDHTETEVKFFIKNVKPVRDGILDIGAVLAGRFFETNIRYDDKEQTLLKKKSLLRLRKDRKTTLTFKSQPAIQDTQFKTLTELEVEVSDFNTMNIILESLGFYEAQRYEKWRETFVLGKTKFLIDSMPYGDFLEIEGEKSDIILMASRIGMNWEERILLNYLEMFGIIKDKTNLPFNDVTFDNFTGITVDMANFMPLFIKSPVPIKQN